MKNHKYQQCTRCIMDNKSDRNISFSKNGFCNYCTEALKNIDKIYFPNIVGEEKLQSLLSRLKDENTSNEYDCVMGISGGLDSSYLAYLGAVQWGLRILGVHVDDGFDTEISKRNIERISKFPNLDLKIIKPNSKQFSELIKAYMRAGVPNLAVPQDNVLFASLYKFLKDNNLRTFLSGGNFALESILQKGNTHNTYDLRNLKYIHKKFGKGSIGKLQVFSAFKKDIDSYVLKIETLRPLNLIDYNRDKAMNELKDYCGFEYYGSKHLENDLTKFIQQYWFYKKFNVDKRTSHLSSMIVSGQLTRSEALEQYKLPIYMDADIEMTINNVLNKLGMERAEFNKIMSEKPHQHFEYPVSRYLKAKPLLSKIKKLLLRG